MRYTVPGFNCFDPLNTAGSLVLNQNPNEIDFQKVKGIIVNGRAYHRTRTVVIMNEDPIYISFTGSAFGVIGALGGKLLGAGGGGFMMFFVQPHKRMEVIRTLTNFGGQIGNANFVTHGTQAWKIV